MSKMESAFLMALHEEPADETSWLALADWLDEEGQADRAELLRVWRSLRGMGSGQERLPAEKRMCELLTSGVLPCGPTVVNALGMRLALVSAGTFWMGVVLGLVRSELLQAESGS